MSRRIMNRRRAWIALLAALAMMMTLLAGCGSTDSAGGEPAAPESDAVRIVTTIFPEYDWVQNIVGEDTVWTCTATSPRRKTWQIFRVVISSFT